MKEVKLVIFDMDGVILDTEPIHLESKEKILEFLGVSGSIDLTKFVGVANEKLWEEVIQKNKLDYGVQKLVRLQDDCNFQTILEKKLTLSKGLKQVLEFLKEKEIQIALASSSTRYFVNRILEHYRIEHYFSLVLTGDDVLNKKPSSEIYEKVLSKMRLKPLEALVIEDSKMGTLAAASAGIPCIGYVNPTSGNQDLSKACKKINSLEEIQSYLNR